MEHTAQTEVEESYPHDSKRAGLSATGDTAPPAQAGLFIQNKEEQVNATSESDEYAIDRAFPSDAMYGLFNVIAYLVHLARAATF
jgi:hypothetical protein